MAQDEKDKEEEQQEITEKWNRKKRTKVKRKRRLFVMCWV
jgi:hypothetical protein